MDGGGVQAAVVEANVGASNGVIHSIDRVGGGRTCTVRLGSIEQLEDTGVLGW